MICMVLALTSAAANTQTHFHVYDDGIISGPDKDYSRFLTGGGMERKWFFVAADSHSLTTPEQVETRLNLFEDLTETNFGLELWRRRTDHAGSTPGSPCRLPLHPTL